MRPCTANTFQSRGMATAFPLHAAVTRQLCHPCFPLPEAMSDDDAFSDGDLGDDIGDSGDEGRVSDSDGGDEPQAGACHGTLPSMKSMSTALTLTRLKLSHDSSHTS